MLETDNTDFLTVIDKQIDKHIEYLTYPQMNISVHFISGKKIIIKKTKNRITVCWCCGGQEGAPVMILTAVELMEPQTEDTLLSDQ